jgi:hypothetical protein
MAMRNVEIARKRLLSKARANEHAAGSSIGEFAQDNLLAEAAWLRVLASLQSQSAALGDFKIFCGCNFPLRLSRPSFLLASGDGGLVRLPGVSLPMRRRLPIGKMVKTQICPRAIHLNPVGERFMSTCDAFSHSHRAETFMRHDG